MNLLNKQALTMDHWLPDAKILAELRPIVNIECEGEVELDSAMVSIDPDCEYQVISKALICKRIETGFGSCFQAVVALGGIESIEHGCVTAKDCFAILWYNLNGEIITIDFSGDIQ